MTETNENPLDRLVVILLALLGDRVEIPDTFFKTLENVVGYTLQRDEESQSFVLELVRE